MTDKSCVVAVFHLANTCLGTDSDHNIQYLALSISWRIMVHTFHEEWQHKSHFSTAATTFHVSMQTDNRHAQQVHILLTHKYEHCFITETVYLEYIIRKKSIFYNKIHAAASSHSLWNTVKIASCTFNEHVFLQNTPKSCLWYS